MATKRPSLNDDVLQDILSLVPAKSLGRFKAASQQWNGLISNPHFQTAQARASVQKPLGFYTGPTQIRGRGEPLYFSLTDGDVTGLGERFRILPSTPHGTAVFLKSACNGLVVFEVWERGTDPVFMVGNPTTKTYRQIPRYACLSDRAVFGLAFDPTLSVSDFKIVHCMKTFANQAGQQHFTMPMFENARQATQVLNQIFGHAPVPDHLHYLLQGTLQSEEEQQTVPAQFVFTVFSPETGEWKRATATLTCTIDNPIFRSLPSVFFNRALYWMRKGGEIVAFDVDQERPFEVAPPDGVNLEFFSGYPTLWFGVAAGCMTLVKFTNGDILIWKLADYGRSEWRFDQRISTPGSGIDKTLIPVFFDGETLVFMTWDKIAGEMKRSGLSVYKIGSVNWGAVVNLNDCINCSRVFLPYISHMVNV